MSKNTSSNTIVCEKTLQGKGSEKCYEVMG